MTRIVPPSARSGRGASAERGFLVIAAIFLVVVLAALVAYLATVSKTAHVASIADLESARSFQAARGGIEWAAYQILRPPGTFCSGGSGENNVSYAGTTLADYIATVRCTSVSYTDGAATVRIYQVTSNACNVPATSGCPGALAQCCGNTFANTKSPVYVERELKITIAN
jgi:MSHA biogenesis protein MshP